MSAVLIEDQIEIRADTGAVEAQNALGQSALDTHENIAIELGIWLSGLESFLASGHHSFADRRDANAVPDSTKEFRLVHSALQRCSMMNARLFRRDESQVAGSPKLEEVIDLGAALREMTILSEGMIHSTSLGSGEWKAWSNLLSHRLQHSTAFAKYIQLAEEAGKRYLPEQLNDFVSKTGFLSAEHAELALILPRFGVILKWLSIVGKMLKADEPLKPALMIFSRINEQIFELTNYINSRLESFPDEEAELFSSLDAASYTASIELKKVYSQELAGIARLRPSPSIYARMETAHSLLNDGFQQILAGFARLFDSDADIFKIFPPFQTKLEESIELRRGLRDIVKIVQSTETSPEKSQIEIMHAELREFMKGPVKFLFYKDTETIERFVEEILITKQNKDLVPILHRFGAYLETLFGQVSLRAVLEKHPFEIG